MFQNLFDMAENQETKDDSITEKLNQLIESKKEEANALRKIYKSIDSSNENEEKDQNQKK